MFLKKERLPVRDTEVKIIVRDKTEERLKGTCFRGRDVMKAGNFILWDSAEGLLTDRDGDTLWNLLGEIEYLWDRGELGTHSFTTEYGMSVGFESTNEVRCYSDEVLEEFPPNHRSTALRVRKDRSDIRAPKTSLITLVFELREKEGLPVVIVHSIYPGEDIGELSGNITDREGRVFFDWEHPGEPFQN